MSKPRSLALKRVYIAAHKLAFTAVWPALQAVLDHEFSATQRSSSLQCKVTMLPAKTLIASRVCSWCSSAIARASAFLAKVASPRGEAPWACVHNTAPSLLHAFGGPSGCASFPERWRFVGSSAHLLLSKAELHVGDGGHLIVRPALRPGRAQQRQVLEHQSDRRQARACMLDMRHTQSAIVHMTSRSQLTAARLCVCVCKHVHR